VFHHSACAATVRGAAAPGNSISATESETILCGVYDEPHRLVSLSVALLELPGAAGTAFSSSVPLTSLAFRPLALRHSPSCRQVWTANLSLHSDLFKKFYFSSNVTKQSAIKWASVTSYDHHRLLFVFANNVHGWY